MAAVLLLDLCVAFGVCLHYTRHKNGRQSGLFHRSLSLFHTLRIIYTRHNAAWRMERYFVLHQTGMVTFVGFKSLGRRCNTDILFIGTRLGRYCEYG